MPARDAAYKRMTDNRVDRSLLPQSQHWDWRDKTRDIKRSLANPSFCVMCDGVTQGMMILNTLYDARLNGQAGKSMVYIEYLEVAPWNRRFFPSDVPRYRNVGSMLVRAAIEYSRQAEFKGRVGLHSLPQSNGFYANTCQMIDLGPDQENQHLRYFEMTPEIAKAFIERGTKP